MGKVVNFPIGELVLDRLIERVERELAGRRERDLYTVDEAFKAVRRGDLDHDTVREVMAGRAGSLDDYVSLCELIRVVAAARRHCGL